MIEFILLSILSAGVQSDIPALCFILPPAQEEETEKTEKRDKKPKPPPIPPLSATDKEKAKRFLTFLKRSDPEKRRSYEDKMVALGRGVIPLLLEKAETTHKHQSGAIARCLTRLLDVKDRELLATLAKSKKAGLRMLVVIKYASTPKEEDKETLKTFLDDSVSEIRLEASLGLVRLGDPAGIKEIVINLAACTNATKRQALTADLPNLKGKVYSSHFRSLATKHEDHEVRKATLEVIVAIGDKRVKDVLGLALKDDHNLVKGAAVNALRKLLKGQEPVTFPTVFDLVDAVEKWKNEPRISR